MKTREEEETMQEEPQPQKKEAGKVVNKLAEELSPAHVIDLFLTGKRIEHAFRIGEKIDVVIAYPKNANAEETMDRMIITQSKEDLAREGKKIGSVESGAELEDKVNNLADHILRASNISHRNILIGMYVVKYHEKVYPESEDFYSSENIKNRYQDLNGLMNGPIKEAIIQRIREFSNHVESCFTSENLINF